jgi:hypothetical protein
LHRVLVARYREQPCLANMDCESALLWIDLLLRSKQGRRSAGDEQDGYEDCFHDDLHASDNSAFLYRAAPLNMLDAGILEAEKKPASEGDVILQTTGGGNSIVRLAREEFTRFESRPNRQLANDRKAEMYERLCI